VIFDDSYYHTAANDHHSEPRIVLIIDLWHIDLTDSEVHVLRFLNNHQIQAVKRLHAAAAAAETTNDGDSDGDGDSEHSNGKTNDFFSAIVASQERGIDFEDIPSIWGSHTTLATDTNSNIDNTTTSTDT
jgi:hypothetical protein